MICCLNPNCTVENSPQPTDEEYCVCGTKLVRLVEHYIPVSRIGKGAYGVTYKAEDTHKRHDICAIKQLTVNNEKARESFRKESEQLQKLNSRKCSRIPQMFGCFEQDGYLYLAQEFIDGKNLTTYLKEEGTFDEEKIRDLLKQLLPVLEMLHKHEEGIIHRDIKPDNIMRRVNGEYVLIDFGISKQLTGHHLPTPGTNVGTEGYASKEQREENITKESSDLYSLGVVCYKMLTGKDPRDALVNSGYSWTAHWASCLSKPINNNLFNIIDKLLKEDYSDRYQTAEDVIKALNPLPETTGLTEEDKYNRKTAILTTAGAKWGVAEKVITVIAVLSGSGFFAWIGLQPKPLTADGYYKNGQELDGKDNKGAIDAYTKAIEINKKHTESYIARGIARRGGDNENAIKDFTEAIRLNSKSSVSYAYRGLTLHDLNESTKAKADFSKVFKIEPNDATDYLARGIAWTDSGNNKEAIKAYNQAINRNPKFWRAYINRGISKHTLSQSKDAIEDYNEAIKLNPSSISAHYNRGIARFALKENKGAVADYSEVIKIKPDSSNAYYQRGIVHEELGNNQEAIDDYTKAAKIFEEKSESEPAKKARDRAKKLERL